MISDGIESCTTGRNNVNVDPTRGILAFRTSQQVVGDFVEEGLSPPPV